MTTNARIAVHTDSDLKSGQGLGGEEILPQEKIRNIAIIAHVDHGKTTLVDQLFRQSGLFRGNQAVAERLMDSMDLERERGITIVSKNGSCRFEDYWINIIDTPGHADFGGQVERVLRMADGALLLVDAQEGPMAQTFFVLRKALAVKLPIIVVINKIDKPAARPHWVLDRVFDLFVSLDAAEESLDFPVVYASAKSGTAVLDLNETPVSLLPLFRRIVDFIPAPRGEACAPLELPVSSIDHSAYLGRLGIGKISSGRLAINSPLVVARRDGSLIPVKVSKIYRFVGNQKVSTPAAGPGEIVAVAGSEDVTVGETYTDPEAPRAAAAIVVDPPTVAVSFIPNDSPFSGQEGSYVTSNHLRERLLRETLSDVALQVEELAEGLGYHVAGRGELHLAILIEKMRREGYEFQVTRPRVITREQDGRRLEPFEELTVECGLPAMGRVMERLGSRRGRLLEMVQDPVLVRLRYRIPTRGLLGFRSEFLTLTRGMGVMSSLFSDYGAFAGEIKGRGNGVLVAKETCTTVAYALFNLQERGRLFYPPGVAVYRGQIVGEHSRENDLVVNPARGKKLTNIRAAGSDENILLTPPHTMSLEECISYINEDELLEVTPRAIRLRKRRPL
jgi:GTP-binding protein